MATTTNFSVRMDSDIKKQCEALYGELGINLTTAINVFLRQSLRVVHADDLARSQFFVVRVSKVDVCKAFKGNTERTIFVSDDRRGTSEAVTGDIDALRGQQENGHGTLDFFLCQFRPSTRESA